MQDIGLRDSEEAAEFRQPEGRIDIRALPVRENHLDAPGSESVGERVAMAIQHIEFRIYPAFDQTGQKIGHEPLGSAQGERIYDMQNFHRLLVFPTAKARLSSAAAAKPAGAAKTTRNLAFGDNLGECVWHRLRPGNEKRTKLTASLKRAKKE